MQARWFDIFRMFDNADTSIQKSVDIARMDVRLFRTDRHPLDLAEHQAKHWIEQAVFRA